ncbi:MAG: GNAT family N-acetyltransferase [Oceanococcus sp.]
MIEWEVLPFSELDTAQLYAIMRLRQQVFVVEQACAFEDADGLDPVAMHLCGWQHGQLRAYARLFAAGEARSEASVGRVVSCPSLRGQGVGIALMVHVIAHLQQWMPDQTVWIGAQERLCPFYARFGFVETGERYLEDGIWHRGMQAAAAALNPCSVT